MIIEPVLPATTETRQRTGDGRLLPTLCWKAILGGTVAAVGIHILLTVLGVGAGLPTFAPITDANPVAHIGTGVALVWSLCALIALWFGGVVAGRFSHSLHSGFVHGILVWGLTLILTLLLLTLGTGLVLGGALKVLGEGLGIGRQAVISAAGPLAKTSLRRTCAQQDSFIEEAVETVPTNATPKALTRARREIGFAVKKLFAPGNDITAAANRNAAITALMQYTEMSQPDATKALDEWTVSFKNLQAELDHLKLVMEQNVRELADQAARNLTRAARWSFFALLLGLLAAALGGSFGARCALRCAESQPGPVR